MNENVDLWRIFDPNPSEGGGCFKILGRDDDEKLMEAHRHNAEGWGIYRTVNSFKGARKTENLESINAWYVECDGGDKTEMLKKIMSGLMPSRIVESKRGYHVYWFSRQASLAEYRNILEFRLIPFYDGDPKAKDVARILREPDFFHCKDMNDRFLVKEVWRKEVFYSEKDLQFFYKLPEPVEEVIQEKNKAKETFRQKFKADDDLFERVYSMDCEQALMRISGTSAVCGESFTFQPATGGKLNILVNGKSTSSWIDKDKRIGSTDKGGPTIWAWINWYHRDHKKTFQYMKESFPELWT